MGGTCSRSNKGIVDTGEQDQLEELCNLKPNNNLYGPLPMSLEELKTRITNNVDIVDISSNIKAPYFVTEKVNHKAIPHRSNLHFIGFGTYENTEFALYGTRVPLSPQNGGYKKVKKYKKTNAKHSFIYQGKSYIRNIHIGSRGGKYVILNKTYVKLNINSS